MAKLAGTDPKTIVRIAIPGPFHRLFDYALPESVNENSIAPGIRVEVPFGNGKKIAYLVETTSNSAISSDKIKTVERFLDDEPLLSARDMELLLWASRYYHHPLGDVISTAFPASLRSGKPAALANGENSYTLSEQGRDVLPTSLPTKSVRQQQVLSFCQEYHPNPVTQSQLKQFDNKYRLAVKALLTKGLLVECEQVLAPPTEPNAKAVSATQDQQDNALVLTNLEDNIGYHLNPDQQKAVAAVSNHADKFAVFLLEGVTGSGKTEVYMHIIRAILQRGQQVLVLVPEINLTPQLEAHFRQRFSVAMAVSHSNLTEKQRHTSWLPMQNGMSQILLGTRSALFTPMAKPGLIILDEEHDLSYKQQEGFRFSARNIAIMRGKILNIPVLLGSATPSLESAHNVAQRRYQYLSLPKRAGNAVQPSLHLLDIRNKKLQSGLSEPLIGEIRKTLSEQGQALIFLNRRGFAPTLICHGCGWVARCRHCDANLVIHNSEPRLRCHHCGQNQRLYRDCPSCHSAELLPLGLGTERIAETLADLFPGQNVVRLDRDSTQRKGTLESLLADINSGNTDLIIGTQMLAKGHHFPNVTLVAIVDVDGGLFNIDFRSPERLAQLIVQVSGRAGRADKPGKVILQTRHPEHPLLTTILKEGYSSFARQCLAERQQAGLPPFSYQALLRAQSRSSQLALAFLQSIKGLAQHSQPGHTQILGPVSAPMEKKAGVFRYQLLFQSSKRNDLQNLLDKLIGKLEAHPDGKKIHWSLDVDPVDLY